MGRKKSRETVIQLLYQKEIVKTDAKELMNRYFEENTLQQSDKEYIETQITGIGEKLQTIDKTIEDRLKSWNLDRISKLDLSILRNAIYEMKYRDDIEISVSINEAVLLCKKYGADDSSVFVNGILGKIAKNEDGVD